jgi:hypothetical protein
MAKSFKTRALQIARVALAALFLIAATAPQQYGARVRMDKNG